MDLIGLRDEDLTDAERAERDALLSDPEHLAEQRFADGLSATLAPFAEADGGATVLPPVRGRSWGLAALALAATVLVAVGLAVGGDDGRWKGGASLGAVELQAFAEGTAGLRPLVDGGEVGVDERVVFRVRTDRPGMVALEEVVDGHRAAVLVPTRRTAGEHVPGGERPQSWRPDVPAEAARYEATWCDAERPDACTTDTLRLRWAR